MLSDAMISYREAWHRWLPLLTVHLYVRLIMAAVLVPVIGALLALTLSFSDQSALTDQDIARFLLTPAGALGALVVVSLVIAAAVVDVAAMTAVLRTQTARPVTAIKAAFGFLVTAAPRLFVFAAELLLRVLLVALPVLAIAAIAAAYLLREYDINFYLTNRPPEFRLAVGIGVVAGGVLLLLLLERLTAWAIALHLSIFDLEPARASFRTSRQKMHGHRRDLFKKIVAWALIRFALAAVLAGITGFLLAEVPQLVDRNIGLFFTIILLLLGIWALLNSFLNAVSNGALADLLNEEFDRSLEARPARGETQAETGGLKTAVLPLAVAALSAFSLLGGGLLSNGIGGLQEVEVIAHRGAAGTRPENTMASVVKAVEDGADWVEIDVQETADGAVLVVHDSDFMKAAGVATKVWNVTMEEVAQIDIGSWFDPAFAEERAPLLRDVLEAVRDRSKLLIELKYYGHDVDLENRVIALVEEAGMVDQVATMSLKYPAVQKMIELRPDWRAGVLAATAVGDLSGLDGDFLAVNAGRVSARLIAAAEASDKQVYAWTVNDPTSMSRMISIGVHGLITDRPAMARAVIDQYQTLGTPERVMLRLGNLVGYAFDVTPEEGGEM